MAASSGSDVNYKAYVENMLSFESSCIGHLESQMFALDDPGEFDDETGASNTGYQERAKFIKKSQTFDLMMSINADFLRSACLLGPRNKLTIKIYRAPDSFLFMCPATITPKLKIEDMRLYYQRIESIAPQVSPEVHHVTHTELTKIALAQGKTNFTLMVNSGGVLPRSVIVFFVRTDAYNGHLQKNPLKMLHIDVSYLALRINGRCVPQDGLRPSFPAAGEHRGRTAREYMWLFQNSGTNRINRGNLMTYERFVQDYTLFCFDTTYDQCNGYHYHNARLGCLEVDVRCPPLEQPVMACIFCVYDMELAIFADGRHDMNYYTVPPKGSSGGGGGGGGGGNSGGGGGARGRGGGGGGGGGGGKKRKSRHRDDYDDDDDGGDGYDSAEGYFY
jgi:hypothetical protein